MIQDRIFPFRRLFLVTPFLFIGIIYFEAVQLLLFFDPNAEDLVNGSEVKAHYIQGVFSYKNALHQFNFYQSFLFPMLIVLAAYMYFFVKKRYLKYMIGKQKQYDQAVRQLKYQLGFKVVSVFLVVLAILSLIGFLVGRTEMWDLVFGFSPTSPLQYLAQSTFLYLLYYAVVKSLSLFVGTVFACYLVDYCHSFIKGALLYLFVMWGLAPVLYAFLPFYLVPMTSLMITSYGQLEVWHHLAPYTLFFLIFLYIRVTGHDEVV